jgi:hypothetical protein
MRDCVYGDGNDTNASNLSDGGCGLLAIFPDSLSVVVVVAEGVVGVTGGCSEIPTLYSGTDKVGSGQQSVINLSIYLLSITQCQVFK